MNIYGPDDKVLISINSIRPDGATLVIDGKLFGSMPLSARLRPEEVRAAWKLMNFRTILFLLTLPFRKSQ
jgi:hypothetical protein